jgi:hypothetical protein
MALRTARFNSPSVCFLHQQLQHCQQISWRVFTDGVPHAALSGQSALEQTFVILVPPLLAPDTASFRVQVSFCGRLLAA